MNQGNFKPPWTNEGKVSWEQWHAKGEVDQSSNDQAPGPTELFEFTAQSKSHEPRKF